MRIYQTKTFSVPILGDFDRAINLLEERFNGYLRQKPNIQYVDIKERVLQGTRRSPDSRLERILVFTEEQP